MNIKDMSFEKVLELVYDDRKCGELSEVEKMELDDKLTNFAWMVGRALDKTHGIDPYKGQSVYGTANKRSYTYKVRKAVGFSYP